MQNGAITLFFTELSIINLQYVVGVSWATYDKRVLNVYTVDGKFSALNAEKGKELIDALLLFHELQNKEK